ncbi:MAG: hypothetical protein IPO92_18330 [Saprospiraceae bacterium]|nr:hypothetical protein [Saprospiraceae bacterium]
MRTITYTWQTTDYSRCFQILTVLPPPEADFINPPASQILDCSQMAPIGLPPLSYANGGTGSCLISGSAIPVRVDNVVNCAGTITFTWSFSDFCNRQKQHVQVLTITPPPEAFPISPPASATINCNEIPPAGTIPVLNYSNGQPGSCLVDGTMTGSRLDEIVNCIGRITFTWTATDRCGRPLTHIQILTILPPPEVTLINPPVYTTPFTCAEANVFVAPNIMYSNNATCLLEGSLSPVTTINYTPCGGTINVSWAGQDACNRPVSYNQIIIVQPASAPSFIGPLPQDITVACSDLSSYSIPLNYSNGETGTCLLSGSITGVLNQPVSICGGQVMVTWSGTDQCGNVLSHIQNITVQEAAQAAFVNTPPPNITATCGMVPTQIPFLSFSNNISGICQIAGSVPGIQSGSYDACGGTIQFTWQFTDLCGRSIVFNQNINVLPASNPIVFLNAPADINLPCGQGFDVPVDLFFSNLLAGPCRISGVATPVTQDFGNYRVYTWNAVNPCTNITITTTQTVTIVPIPDIVIDPNMITICEGESYNLSTIAVTDLNGNQNTVKTYHTESPATNFNKITNPLVYPDVFQNTYVIKITNAFGCSDEEIVQFNINEQIGPGEGLVGNECRDESPVNLWTYISGVFDPNGYWEYNGSGNINISDPTSVNFSNANPGFYFFDYIVEGTNGCPGDTAYVVIDLVNPGTFTIGNIACSANFQTYSVQLTSIGYTVSTTAGTVVPGANNSFTITNIPIAQSITITFSNTPNNCTPQSVNISPPNCSCPQINAPISNGDLLVCQNASNVILSVTVGAGLSANWYSTQVGGTILQANSLTYSPPTNTTGNFTYYCEAIDLQNGCISNLRTPVSIEVVSNPVVNNATLRACDINSDGITEFDLNLAKNLITPNPANNVTFYLTLAEANSGMNPLNLIYTNTTPNQIIFARVTNNNNCISITQLTLESINPPNFTVNVVNETCLNAKDGSIQVVAPGINTYKINSLPWTDIPLFNDLAPNTYLVAVRSVDLCISTSNVVIDPGQVLTIASYTIQCNNNGTASQSNDDFYEVSFSVSNSINALNQYEVFFNGSSKGLFNYNISSKITLPANGMTGLLEFKDLVLGCKTSKVVNNLTPCSTDCQITFTQFSSVCFDNGTQSDGTDDFYTIKLFATALNGSNTNMYNVLVDNVIKGTFSYGTLISFVLPADGNIPIILLRDVDDIQCISNVPISALTACSGSCLISKTITNILCNDNGTINDPGDDFFTFDIRVTGLNISAGWLIQGDPTLRAYNTSYKLGPYNIASGNIIKQIYDNVDNNCTSTLQVQAPSVCSSPCVLIIEEKIIGNCDDNGTGNTPEDDKFSVSFKVKIVSGSANFYYVTDGSKIFGPFNYNQTANINNLLADGSSITLSIYDGINAGCIQSFVISQLPCSGCKQTVNAGADVILTCAQNTATLTANASESGVYSWTGPNGFVKTGQTIQTSTPGTYIVSVLFPDQCVATDMVTVSKDSGLPVSNAGPDGVITCTKKDAMLTGTSNLNSGVKYVWTNSSGAEIGNTLNITLNQPGFYYFEVINLTNNCASGKDEVEIKDNTTIPAAIIFADPGNLLDCIIGSVTLSGQPVDNVIFSWLFKETVYSNRNFIVIDEAGLVTMTAIDTINGCINSAQLEIIDLQDYPILLLEPVEPITCANNSTIISAQNSPAGPNLIFQWYNSNNIEIAGETQNMLSVDIPGIYFVILTDTLNGCSNKDSIVVNRIGDFPQITVPPDKILYCSKADTTLSVSIINPVENPIINWSSATGIIEGPKNTTNIKISGGGLYRVEVTYPTSGCKSVANITIVVDDDAPKAILAQKMMNPAKVKTMVVLI